MAIAQSLRTLSRQDGLGIKKTDQFIVNPSDIQIKEGFNIRAAIDPHYWESDEAKMRIRKLADAYKAGAHVPKLVVKVIDGVIFLVDGEHRLKAIRLATTEGYECQAIAVDELRGDETDMDALLVTQHDGAPVGSLQLAIVFDRYVKRGFSVQEIAQKFGRHYVSVEQLLDMLNMPYELKLMVSRNVVAATFAMKLFREHGTKAVDLVKEKYEELKEKNDSLGLATETPVETNTEGKSAKKRALISEKHLKPSTGIKIPKNTALEMHTQFMGLTSKLDTIKPKADGSIVLELSADELKKLIALRDILNGVKTPADKSVAETKAEEQLDLLDGNSPKDVDEAPNSDLDDLDINVGDILDQIDINDSAAPLAS